MCVMCSVTGLLRIGGGDTDSLSGHCARDGAAAGLSRAGRRRCLRRWRIRHRLWPSSPVDHRSDGSGRPADAFRSAVASPSPSTARSTIISIFEKPLRQPALRQTGAVIPTPRRLLHAIRHWGVEESLRTFQRHVRLRGMGSSRPHVDAVPRSLRREAFILWLVRLRIWCSPRAESVRRASGVESWSSIALALTSFMRSSYVPAPWSIWQGVRKLPAGSLVTFSISADGMATWPQSRCLVVARAHRERGAQGLADERERGDGRA